MAIFRIQKNKVSQISLNEQGFGNEFELRDLFAENLEEILGVRFLAKEYQTTDGRIDTLGIDESNSPVIIEYKWKENEEILSQGLFYFNWLMKNKKHFELLVANKLGANVKVNWDQPRVILVAQGFNRYIQAAVQQVNNVELKTYNYYGSDILHLESVYSPVGIKVNTGKTEPKEDKSIYDLNYHFGIANAELQKKANQLRELILQLPSIEEKVGQKTGITYKTTKSFTRLEFRKTWIQLLLRDSSYQIDTQGLVKDISINEWGYKGMVKFTVESDVDYVFNLIKDSYESTL
jgi:predicted transport protein